MTIATSPIEAICRDGIPGYDPWGTAEDGMWFDEQAAQDAVDFFQDPERGCLRHIEGALAGQLFRLEPWQQAIVGNIFGWKRKDKYDREVRRYREVFIFVPRKNGKMLALDTPLPTPTGWTTMGEIRVGDKVFDEQGNPCTVTYLSQIDMSPKSYLMRFSNGEQIRACADHLWVTNARVDCVGAGRRKPGESARPGSDVCNRSRTTQEIYETQRYGARGDRNHSVRMPAALELPEAALPIDPYVLGVWLGDGDSDCARVTMSDLDAPDLTKHLLACGCNVGKRAGSPEKTGRYRIGSSGIRGVGGKDSLSAKLRSAGLLKNKHIPRQYLRSSKQQRLSLLQGLMDTDGTISGRGLGLQFVSCNKTLAEDVAELLSSLGIKFSWREKQPRCNGRLTDSTAYMLQFMAFSDKMPAFRLSRKLARMRRSANPQRKPRSETVQIVSVEPCASVPMRCIGVDSESHQYLCGRTMIPTHNTPLAAGIANYVLFCDGESGAQCYCAAADRDQAAIVYQHAKGMVEQEPELETRCQIYKAHKSIVLPDGSFLKVLSADAHTKHGGNSHLVIVDELHAQPNRDLVDVLQTSMASANRPQPLIVFITTSDFDGESICNEKHSYASKVRDGIVPDASFLPVIYEAQKGDDYTDPKVWAKANPNLDVSVSREYLERESRRAKEEPAYLNTFLRLHLNIRTQTETAWEVMDYWDLDSNRRNVLPVTMEGRECYAGLDMASTTDTASFVLLFPEDGGAQVVPYFWIPEENIHKREHKDRAPYAAWGNQGFLRLTHGNYIDQDQIRRDIVELGKKYRIKGIAIDRWNTAQITTQLQGDGFEVVLWGQGFASMSGPMKELQRLVMAGRFQHGGNPVLRWMASNTMLETDAAGNIKPSKGKSTGRIDGIAASAMAVGLMMANPQEPEMFSNGGIFLI